MEPLPYKNNGQPPVSLHGRFFVVSLLRMIYSLWQFCKNCVKPLAPKCEKYYYINTPTDRSVGLLCSIGYISNTFAFYAAGCKTI